MNNGSVDSTNIPITLKWGKHVYLNKISIAPNSPTQDLKKQIEELTLIPIYRQKILCKGGWKGILKDTCTHLPSDLSIPKGKDALVVTVMGSAEILEEKAAEDRPRFIEDIASNEGMALDSAEKMGWDWDTIEGDIIPLQRLPQDRNDNKMEMYQYSRLVTGLPQRQIEDLLRSRRKDYETDESGLCERNGELLGKAAMTMGKELRRAYVNSLAILNDGTLVSALDDGHVQMWCRGALVQDIVHEGGEGGVDKVVTLQKQHNAGTSGHMLNDDCDDENSPAFATGGRGVIKIWSKDGDCIRAFDMPPGTSPASLASGFIRIAGTANTTNNNTGNSTITSNNTNIDERGIDGNHHEIPYLASCFKITRQSNPNQFRLVPQDEAGRRRRDFAIAQERALQERLWRVSLCVRIWVHAGNFGPRATVLEPPNLYENNLNGIAMGSVDAAPVVELAVVNQKLVCGDEWGGMRVWDGGRFTSNNGDVVGPSEETASTSLLSWQQYAFLQFRCSDSNYDCSIVCMKPIRIASNDCLMAVSTDALQVLNGELDTYDEALSSTELSRSRVFSSAMPLQVTKARAVYVVDLDRASVLMMLNVHTDVVQCMCPLPCGGLLTAGGRMDATVRMWRTDTLNVLDGTTDEGERDVLPEFTEAKKLDEPGYVFDLLVLPDSKPGSRLYAIAGARYNVVKIVI